MQELSPESKSPASPSFAQRFRIWLQRVCGGACLSAMAFLLFMHVAVAYSPEIANYVPDVFLSRPEPLPVCRATDHSACSNRTKTLPAPGGCSLPLAVDPPLLTDALYAEDEVEFEREYPADAWKCLSQPAL